MMHRFVVTISNVDAKRLHKMGRENGITYDSDTHQWFTPDRKRAAIFAFALVGFGASFNYTCRKEAASGQESSEVPRSRQE